MHFPLANIGVVASLTLGYLLSMGVAAPLPQIELGPILTGLESSSNSDICAIPDLANIVVEVVPGILLPTTRDLHARASALHGAGDRVTDSIVAVLDDLLGNLEDGVGSGCSIIARSAESEGMVKGRGVDGHANIASFSIMERGFDPGQGDLNIVVGQVPQDLKIITSEAGHTEGQILHTLS